MSYLFDTHCHLTDPILFESSVLSPAVFSASSQHLYLTVGTQQSDWQSVCSLSKSSPFIFSALGLHPWFIDSTWQSQLLELEALLQSHHIDAVGEIGLDFSAEIAADRDLQLKVFEAQLALAKKFNLPVSIHCRKAFNEVKALLKQYDVNAIMHGFSGGLNLAIEFVKLGAKLGVNPVILKPNARRYHEMVKGVGIEHLVLETDAPNGQTDQGTVTLNDITRVADKIANLLDMSTDKVMEQTFQNADTILQKEQG